MGWDLCQPSEDGVALGVAVGAGSIVSFPWFGLLQSFPPACLYSLFPVQDLAQTLLHFLASSSQSTWRGDAAWD